MCTKRFIQTVVLTMCLSPFYTQAAVVYEVIDLGTLGGDESRALSINDFGQIVGEADGHATLFDPTGAGNNIDLGTLEDPLLLSCATSVNNVGQIVGYSYYVFLDMFLGESRATSFDPTGAGNNIDLGTPGGNYSRAFAINDGGQVVGMSARAFQLGGGVNNKHATLFDPNGAGDNLDLGLGCATGINNAGQIIGWREGAFDTIEAILFDGNHTVLGSGDASCINDAGQIVGTSEDWSATLFDPTGGGDNVNLGTLGHSYVVSGATSINNVGQIVGSSGVPLVSEYRATLFDPTGTGNNIDLNTVIDPDSGWILRQAEDINNNGWIVGSGINPQGEQHAFLLIPKYSGGTGEPNDPYQIATAEDLIVLGETPDDYDKHFILTADIDLDANLPGSRVFDTAVIAMDTNDVENGFQGIPFTGVFDGNGHVVSHLTIKGAGFLGLFGLSEWGSEIRNLGLLYVNISGSGDLIGALLGYSNGDVTRCYSTGVIRGSNYVGGLVGHTYFVHVIQCCGSGVVSGDDSVGGLVGGAMKSLIQNCYSVATISGKSRVGGLVGSVWEGGSLTSLPPHGFSYCYSAGPVMGESRAGGLLGEYSGDWPLSITECFWDTQISGQATSAGGTGKTTAEMQAARTFLEAGWDFVGETDNGTEDIWKIAEGLGYPRLAWEKYSGGTGEPNDPYRIATAPDLIALGETPDDYDKHFILTADIDLDPNLPGGRVFDRAIIAPGARVYDGYYFEGVPFIGVFDGNGHTISNLTIMGERYLGLFGQLGSTAHVFNLGLEQLYISGADALVGGLTGYNEGKISASYSTGVVRGVGEWSSEIGGLVGINSYRGSIRYCYSMATVSAHEGVGGLVGENEVKWAGLGYSYGHIFQCYSAGPVAGETGIGGLVGVGDLGTVDSVWDIETSGLIFSAGGTGRTTIEMLDPGTFMTEEWDFVGLADGPHDIWAEPEGGGYPILNWQLPVGSGLPGFPGGNGEPNDPYLISTEEELNSIGHNPRLMKSHFKLINDLDLTGFLFYSIGDRDYAYRGVFDGDGHTVSNLTAVGGDCVGMFSHVGVGAEVRDVGIVNVNITGSGEYAGGLVGYNSGATVIGCYSSGVIQGTPQYAGGLVGYNTGEVKHCNNAGTVNTSLDAYVGGLVGGNSGSITTCCNTGEVSCDGMWERGVGGVAGYNSGTVNQCYSSGVASGPASIGAVVGSNDGNVTNCYGTGAVSGGSNGGGLVGWFGGPVTGCFGTGRSTGRYSVGGLVGTNTGRIKASYSTGMVSGESFVGGLVGENPGGITTSYSIGTARGNESVGGLVGRSYGSVLHGVWDRETSGLSQSAGGVGLTTVEMMDPHVLGLNGFSNDPNWVLDASLDYPRLDWEKTPGNAIPEPIIDWLQGRGTSEDPYRIDTASQLILLGKWSIFWDRHLALGADIDMNPKLPGRHVFTDASIPTFMGVFDGRGHTISHLTIKGGSYLGLFGQLHSGAEVKDLGLTDVDITGSGDCTAGLAGNNDSGSITNCYTTGTVNGENLVGSLVGDNDGDVASCYSAGQISGSWIVGGLVGSNDGRITTSHSVGAVSGGSIVGGLVGDNWRGSVTVSFSNSTVNGTGTIGGLVGANDGIVAECYSTGVVTGDHRVGGLVGDNHGDVANCYSTGRGRGNHFVGGFIGYHLGDNWWAEGLVTDCFWDTQTSGLSWSDGGTGLTTTDMQTARTFLDAGWDFVGETANGTEDIWWIDEGQDYPRLWWEVTESITADQL